jgi:hypothetical protein
MSSIVNLTSLEADQLFDLLAKKDLESRANSYFSITSYKIAGCLDVIKLNGRQFNDREKNIIANKAGSYSLAEAEQIDKNLLFLANRNAGNLDLLEKIHYIRGRLSIENQPYQPNFDRKALTNFEIIMRNYSDFESAIPKWADYMVAERKDLHEYIVALTSVFGRNTGSVFLFMFLLLDKFEAKEVMSEFGEYIKNINMDYDAEGFISINKYNLLKIISDFVIYFQSKQKQVGFNETIRRVEFERESQLLDEKKWIVSESEEGCSFEGRAEMKKDSKRVPIIQNELLNKISDSNQWIKKILIYFKDGRDLEFLYYTDRFINGKMVRDENGNIAKFKISEEEKKFYDEKIKEIENAAKKENIPDSGLKEFALKYLKELQNEMNELDSPQQFYGENCPKTGLHRGLSSAITSSMRVDEDRLHQKYQEFLESRGISNQRVLTQDEENELFAEMHEWIDRSAHESHSLVSTTKEFNLDVLNKYNQILFDVFLKIYQRPVSREKVHERDKNDGSGLKYEEIKRAAYNHPLFMELDQRETSLREQKDKFPPAEFERAISLIQDERAVVGRILEIMNSRNVRNLKSQEEIFKAIAEALSSADEMINIDLPVYFPERLHKYFELYHKDRMEKVAESSLTR